jgi:aminocarboxymuconate-semialdehyde decarboxylase
MGGPQTIDVHAHILAKETISLIAKAAPVVAPKLTHIDQESSLLEIAGTPYRPFPRGGFDLERRLRDMDAAQVDMQVVSNTPQTFLYNLDPAVTATCCRILAGRAKELLGISGDAAAAGRRAQAQRGR